jgi:DNA polymerase-4
MSSPPTILHIDGDSFFVSCELARRPDLRGRPVVTGLEKGIASAMSPEAKKRGIYRGMRIHEMRRVCPEVVILPSDYDMYAQYAQRMYRIVRRYTDCVEEYSIDECFADLAFRPVHRSLGVGGSFSEGGSASPHSPSEGGSYPEIAAQIQRDLRESLGITFSVGLSVNKVLAKIASKYQKPAGFTVIDHDRIAPILRDLPIGAVWGIGASTTLMLKKLGITTALDLAEKDRSWIAENCDLPVARIAAELRGTRVLELSLPTTQQDYASVQRTRTFRPPSRDREFCWSQLSIHVEDACVRIRRDGLVAGTVSFFLKTQDFEYLGEEVPLPEASAEPQEILRAIRPRFEALYVSRLLYRTAGVTLFRLRSRDVRTPSLFGDTPRLVASVAVTEAVDRLSHRFGRGIISLGSSIRATRHDEKEYIRARIGHAATAPQVKDREVHRKHFDLIFLGEVK